MKKYFLIVIFAVFGYHLHAQDNTFGIGRIIDNATGLPKSFAFYQLLSQNQFAKDGVVLQPKILDFVYTPAFGIEGVLYENIVNLKLYHNGKKIKDIKCDNDWEAILNNLAIEIEKAGGFTIKKKNPKINEGRQTNFYSKRIVDNLPSKLTIQVPDTKLINYKSFKANIVKFNGKSPYKEIAEIYGKFGKANINDIDVFSSQMVPENFKASVKPLVYPISKTMTYSFKLLSYGGLLTEQKDYGAALNCFYAALHTTKEILASEKEVAILKSFIFKNISNIYGNDESKKELAGLYLLGYDLNNDFSNSDVARNANENYYAAISKVEGLCETVDGQVRISRMGMGLMVLGAVSNGLSANSSSLTSLGVDVSPLTTSLNAAAISSATVQASNTQFFNQLASVNDLLKAETFIVDGLDVKAEDNYVSLEVLNYLMKNPQEVKPALTDFAKDKPKLKELLSKFYSAGEEEKKTLVKDIYLQFSKIEIVITGLEARNRPVEEKYKSYF